MPDPRWVLTDPDIALPIHAWSPGLVVDELAARLGIPGDDITVDRIAAEGRVPTVQVTLRMAELVAGEWAPDPTPCSCGDPTDTAHGAVHGDMACHFPAATTPAEADPPRRVASEPNEVCPKPIRGDGSKHSWRFDGDDPYVICAGCDEMRDAITGRVVRAAAAAPTPAGDGPDA